MAALADVARWFRELRETLDHVQNLVRLNDVNIVDLRQEVADLRAEQRAMHRELLGYPPETMKRGDDR